jgi:hypothetical protein
MAEHSVAVTRGVAAALAERILLGGNTLASGGVVFFFHLELDVLHVLEAGKVWVTATTRKLRLSII